MSGAEHDRALAGAFDGQAEQFSRAPVQTDPAALGRLVAFARLPPSARVLAAGCGPGLVSAALLDAGHRVLGVDLSAEMIRRARDRNAQHGERARFEQRSLFELQESGFDASVSRFVIHHVLDPLAFIKRQVELLRPGGALVACDHTTDPDAERARWHQGIEVERDVTHTRNLTGGQLADLLAAAGLAEVELREEAFTLDFDEWFDRGTPGSPKEEVRGRLLAGTARGFAPRRLEDGRVEIACWRAMARGVKP